MALGDNKALFERFSAIAVQDDRGETVMTLRFAEFVDELTRQINQNITISGSGDPEGSVEAEPMKLYYDEATKTLYIKETGSGNTGWQSL